MKNIATLASLIIGLCMSVSVQAAKVTAVKGKSVSIKLEGDPAQPGDVFNVYDSMGKRRALVKIKSVKGDQATAVKGKGIVRKGYTLKLRPAKSAKSDSSKKSTASRSQKKAATKPSDGRSYWGAMAGLAMDSVSVQIDNNNDQVADKTAELSGMGFSVKGLFDYQLIDQIWFRGLAGIEGLSASGSTEVGCDAKACNVNIYYLAVDFWGKYIFSEGNFRPWAGAGFSLMFPLSKDSSALDNKSISNTSVISIGGGIDWFISSTMYIPVQLEYGMLPESETVKANTIALRAGIAWPF